MIFVSSTFKDLAEQRKKAVETISNFGHIPIALENFPASESSSREVIETQIANSQIYLLILGPRYGEIMNGGDISFTEYEYRLAEKNGLMILAFLLSPAEIDAYYSSLDNNDPKARAELDTRGKLESFVKDIQSSKFYKLWGKNDDFKYLVLDALRVNVPKCELPGFVREPRGSNKKILFSAKDNPFVVDIVRKLTGFEKLNERCGIHPALKRQLGEYFCAQYGNFILENKVSLFFESGSTIAYVSKAMISFLSEHNSVRNKIESREIEIKTNNILTYLQFLMDAKLPCTLFPVGYPVEPYGASYGYISNLSSQPPDYSLPPINRYAIDALNKLKRSPNGIEHMKLPALILGATSGLQLSNNHSFVYFDDENEILEPSTVKPECRQIIEPHLTQCYGPHVGSYHNRLFKRYLYETGVPVMVFITGGKIDRPITIGRCHFVCDRESLSWETLKVNYPLAFCVGCLNENREANYKAFVSQGFAITKAHTDTQYSLFVASNEAFRMAFDKEN